VDVKTSRIGRNVYGRSVAGVSGADCRLGLRHC